MTLTANAGLGSGSGYTYRWSTGQTAQVISVSGTGSYIVTAYWGSDSAVSTAVQVTVNPTPHAYFTLQPDTSTLHAWYAINQCTGNQLSYLWSWGDGATSTGATPTHTYSDSGYYDICVNITDQLGCTDYYCDSSVFLNKTANQMVTMTVVQGATGIHDLSAVYPDMKYYAGAVHFSEAITIPSHITLYDLSGRAVMDAKEYTGSVLYVTSGIADGVYIVRLQNNGYAFSKKIMITR